jgi:hypothetical protein
MVFRKSKSKRSNTKRRYTKRRYTKRRGGSHKRKVYRNKHGRKSYRVRRGGETGDVDTCKGRCRGKYFYDGNKRNGCIVACNNSALDTYPIKNKVVMPVDAILSDHNFEFPEEYFPSEVSAPDEQPQQPSSSDE